MLLLRSAQAATVAGRRRRADLRAAKHAYQQIEGQDQRTFFALRTSNDRRLGRPTTLPKTTHLIKRDLSYYFFVTQSRQGSQELSHSPSRLPRPNRNLDEVMTQSTRAK